MSAVMRVFRMKHPGSCSGMFWRDAPTPELKKAQSASGSKPDWPRNGALMKGEVHDLASPVQGSHKWLQVSEYIQAGKQDWVPTPGCWMQFEQGGLLLHEEKTA